MSKTRTKTRTRRKTKLRSRTRTRTRTKRKTKSRSRTRTRTKRKTKSRSRTRTRTRSRKKSKTKTRRPMEEVGFKFAKKNQYSSKKKIGSILRKYKKMRGSKSKILVICHGTAYTTYPYLPAYKDVIQLDINILAKPNILGDAWDPNFINRFPEGYFDLIWFVHCPIGDPTSHKNLYLWRNVIYLLRSGGIFKDKSIAPLYHLRNRNYSPSKARRELKKFFQQYFSKIKFTNQRVKMTRYDIGTFKLIDDIIVMTK